MGGWPGSRMDLVWGGDSGDSWAVRGQGHGFFRGHRTRGNGVWIFGRTSAGRSGRTYSSWRQVLTIRQKFTEIRARVSKLSRWMFWAQAYRAAATFDAIYKVSKAKGIAIEY